MRADLKARHPTREDEVEAGPQYLPRPAQQRRQVVHIGGCFCSKRFVHAFDHRIVGHAPAEGGSSATHADGALEAAQRRARYASCGDPPSMTHRPKGVVGPRRQIPSLEHTVEPMEPQPFKGLALICEQGGGRAVMVARLPRSSHLRGSCSHLFHMPFDGITSRSK